MRNLIFIVLALLFFCLHKTAGHKNAETNGSASASVSSDKLLAVYNF